MLDVSVVEVIKRSVVTQDGTLSPNSIIYKIDIGDKSPSKISERCNSSSTDRHTSQTTRLSYRVVVNHSLNRLSEKKHLPSTKKSSQVHLPHRSDDLRKMRDECQLFSEFEDGTRILTQDELHGISTGLIRAESGSDKFIQTIREHSYFDGNPKRYADWAYYLSYMKKTKHPHLPCDRFCPYKNQCHHAKDILSTSKQEYHTTKKLANCDDQFYSIDEAAADFNQTLEKVIVADVSAMYKNLHVINSPTGVGKSTAVLNTMRRNPKCRYLVAPPTVDLKNKYYEDAIAQGIQAVKSPSLIEYKDKLPTEVWNHIQGLYQIGKHHAVMDYIREIIAKKDADKDSLDILKNYLHDMNFIIPTVMHLLPTAWYPLWTIAI